MRSVDGLEGRSLVERAAGISDRDCGRGRAGVRGVKLRAVNCAMRHRRNSTMARLADEAGAVLLFVLVIVAAMILSYAIGG